ncbi:MAG: threonine--tRNA ligase [Bacilli bacterium]
MKIQLQDGSIKEIEKKSVEAFEVLNHSTSHLMAEAIKALYPDAKFGFGPSIEEGFYYDVDFNQIVINDEDLIKIEKKMREIASKNNKIIRRPVSKKEALEIFKDNPYKIELIEGIENDITIFSTGNFVDLCAGPHLLSTEPIKHFKLLNIAGAYWRGDSKNKQLTRIYGTSWFTSEDLTNYLNLVEERKRRDHRVLGKQLELFMVSEYGPGFPFWLPNGMILKNQLIDYWTKQHIKYDYQFVETPIILSRELWEISGHWDHYRANMYTLKIDEKDFAIKPMNCPGGILIYKNGIHSYRDLPIRAAELGRVHRHEASGALNGLFRVRAFTQDDAHIYCRRDQINDEIVTLLQFFDEMYSVFGLKYSIELSTRPESGYIGDISLWDEAEQILEEACRNSGKEFKINPGDGAFYGPKLDFKLKDSVGRIWQCGTIQLDMNLPGRFEMSYIDDKGEKVQPIMLHRACLGSLERFIGILIEHYAGAFPVWLAPLQINVLPVNNQYHLDYAKEVCAISKENDLRINLDDSEEKLGYRLRNSQVKKIPLTIVIGDNEVEKRTVTYRRYGQKDQVTISLDEFIEMVKKEIDQKIAF